MYFNTQVYMMMYVNMRQGIIPSFLRMLALIHYLKLNDH